MSNLFISHSSRDNEAAKALQVKLAEQGHRSVFLDLDPDAGIQAGVSWERTLYTKLRACRAVVALCSDSYLRSQWCFAEVALARMEGKDLFVLQIDPWSEETEMPSILMEEQFIDLRTDPDQGYHRLWNGFKVKGIVPSEQRDWRPEEPPYPGLRAFHEEDAAIFFGREKEVREGAEMMARIRRQGHPRIAMVLGASGSGKSSMVRAGLVPALRRNAKEWRIIDPFRPGKSPIQELAINMARAFDEDGQAATWQDLMKELDPSLAPGTPSSAEPPTTDDVARKKLISALSAIENEVSQADENLLGSLRALQNYLERPKIKAQVIGEENALRDMAHRLLRHSANPDASLVLVIDQFEELLDHDEDHPCSLFLDMLRDALDTEDCPIIVIGTMRSDYLGLLQRAPALQGVGFRTLSVGPMGRDGMRQVIAEPAKLGQIQLEDGLPEMLLDDTETADALPLLAFTLRLMWDRYRANHRMQIVEYRELGGLQGAVAQVAEETYQTAIERAGDTEAQANMERDLRDAFLSMARPAAGGSGWARQPVNWGQFSDPVQKALKPFIDPQRLLVKRQDGTVEVAHEALFRSWHTLKHWLDDNAEGLYLLHDIQIEAAKWSEAGQDAYAYLWKAGRLARAVELRDAGVLTLDDDDLAFLDASLALERAEADAKEAARIRELKRTRLFAGVVAFAFLIACGLGGMAWMQRNAAAEQSAIAQAQTAISLLDVRPVDGLINAIEAADPDRILSLTKHEMHPDIQAALIEVIRQSQAARIERTSLNAHGFWVRTVAFHPLGQGLVSADDGGVIVVWSPDGKVVSQQTTQASPIAIEDIAASPDGTFFVAVGQSGVFVRDWAQNDAMPWLKPPDADNWTAKATSVAISPDSRFIAVGYVGGAVLIWNRDTPDAPPTQIDSNEGLGPENDPEDVGAVAFTHDGQRLATGGSRGRVRLWALDGASLQNFVGHTDFIESFAFTPDGQYMLSASDDQTVRRWELLDPGEQTDVTDSLPFLGHLNQVLSVAVSPDGSLIASAGEDRTIRLWNINGARVSPPIRGHAGPVFQVAFSPDGQTMASSSLDLTVKLWDRPRAVAVHSMTPGVSVSDDGSVIATGGLGPSNVQLFDWSLSPLADAVPFEGHPEFTGRVEQTSDGEIVSYGLGGVLVSDKTGAQVRAMGDPFTEGRALAVSPDGALYATGNEDSIVKVYNRDGGDPIATLEGDTLSAQDPVRAIALGSDGADGRLLAFDAGGGFVWLGTPEGQQLGSFQPHDGGIYSLQISLDGKRLLSAGRDRKIVLSDLSGVKDGQDPKVIQEITGHVDVVSTAKFFLDDQFIASASEDNSVRIWRLDGSAVGHPMVEHQDWVLWLDTDEVNERLYTVDKHGVLRRWDMSYLDDNPDALLARTCTILKRHSIGEPADKAREICAKSGH